MKIRYKYNSNIFFILPAAILFFLIIVFPIIYNIYYSFFKWDGISIEKIFIGFENYSKIFQDKITLISLKNTLLFILITVSLQIILGFIFADMISIIIKKYRVLATVFRTIFFLPVIIAPVFVGIIFTSIYHGQFGYLNRFLALIGLDFIKINWIGDPKIAIYSVLITYVWWTLGFATVIYLSAMQGIPMEYYESADIDGANTIQKAIYLTFPLLRSSHYTLTILGAIAALSTFPLVYTMTRGGPIHSTSFLTIYLFENFFILGKAGYASSISIIMLILAFIITVFQLRLYRRGT